MWSCGVKKIANRFDREKILVLSDNHKKLHNKLTQVCLGELKLNNKNPRGSLCCSTSAFWIEPFSLNHLTDSSSFWEILLRILQSRFDQTLFLEPNPHMKNIGKGSAAHARPKATQNPRRSTVGRPLDPRGASNSFSRTFSQTKFSPEHLLAAPLSFPPHPPWKLSPNFTFEKFGWP